MKLSSAAALAALLFFSILTMWLPDRWPLAIFQIGIFALGIAWALRMLVRPYPVRSSIMLAPLTLAVLWPLCQLALRRTVYRWETWNAALSWTASLALFVLALQIFDQPPLRLAFLRSLLWFGFFLSILSSLQLFTAHGKIFWLFPTDYKDDLVMGPFVYKNQYAAFIELLLPVALAAAMADRRRMPLYALIAAAMSGSVIASASRTGFLLVTLELLLVPLLAFHQKLLSRHRGAVLLALVLALTATLTLAAGWDVLWNRLQQPDPYTVRREFFRSSLDMIRDRPGMGFGLGAWPTAYPAYAAFDNGRFANQAHNDWVQWAAEGGLPFLVLMLWLALWSIRPALRSIWGLGVPCIFLHCLVDYPLQKPALMGMQMLFLAMLANESSP
jgi:O-antigen ligase